MRSIIFILCFAIVSSSFSQISRNLSDVIDKFNSGNHVNAMIDLKKVASSNDIAAQYFLAVSYENGLYYDKNVFEAIKYYKRCAERGLPDAMYRLAQCYFNGVGVPQNEVKSKEWLTRFHNKGGQLILLDFVELYNKSLLLSYNAPVSNNSCDTCISNTVNNQTINNITIVQQVVSQISQSDPNQNEMTKTPLSDVDQDIPSINQNNENTFALIIANENYQDVAKVPNALNDGEIFAEYCKKTLGLPSPNVVIVKDATYNNIKREINKLSQIANAYNGSAKIVFYYAGHGVPNEATKDAFLLPVDGYGTDTSTGYSLKELYAILGQLPAEQVVVLLDACFSGSQRGEGMLASARGVAIKAKPNKVDGKMVILSAAQGDETAYPYEEQRHGLFTYYLLKKIQETNGNVSLGDLAAYIKDNVSKKSIVVNGKPQTPSVSPSAILGETWKNWKLY